MSTSSVCGICGNLHLKYSKLNSLDANLEVKNLPARHEGDLGSPDGRTWTRLVLGQDQHLVTE